MEKNIIELGNKLVEQFKSKSDQDIISNWMAFYIAELITKIEKSEQSDKLKTKCFNTILELWSHRAQFSKNKYPFYNFNNLFKTLEEINPNNINPYYYNVNLPSLSDFDFTTTEENQWLSLAKQIDNSARTFIEYIFRKVSSNAINNDLINWIKLAYPIKDFQDISLIRKMSPIIVIDGEDVESKINEENMKSLENNINSIKNFIKLSKLLIDELETELQILQQNNQ